MSRNIRGSRVKRLEISKESCKQDIFFTLPLLNSLPWVTRENLCKARMAAYHDGISDITKLVGLSIKHSKHISDARLTTSLLWHRVPLTKKSMKRSVRATGRTVARIFNIGDGHREAFFRCISRSFIIRISLPRTSMPFTHSTPLYVSFIMQHAISRLNPRVTFALVTIARFL